ncbi:MAG: AbrB/MazE/SpoVT family DNA-binding domain-containing protein [Candidatus Omnitrophica bacterium]|nr:AbrB/MazE/SpoVT family DNA-binding domain-containing protein [Candidatus Omnitrophota bacterium]MBU0896875.1 AbrB/MazE/SpoVT family DNA-binding domain-containing protein [Candidatus Omnitrophota bacterium]MBU1134275.1 AbrB/MazE/SpoVT family DNA-binding domain-containing protein [Candidatus Omnitrophota bacterium]MBU1367137.1 AbrB/MazE/SpoVT family DNA-binding domain-containing protein [Candidatus Omnitrophota bacterium]MBU1524588.1 AbrB/MazE/SpoVT family DNA-binding domain-containing protein
MEIQDVVKVTSKGQVTIPNRIRKRLHLEKNHFVSFKMTNQGVLLFPVEIKEQSPYTDEEWSKIEKLASKKGKRSPAPQSAKKHIDSL